jgi:hypothetical protein
LAVASRSTSNEFDEAREHRFIVQVPTLFIIHQRFALNILWCPACDKLPMPPAITRHHDRLLIELIRRNVNMSPSTSSQEEAD